MKGWSGTLGERRDPSSALFITGTQVTSATVDGSCSLKICRTLRQPFSFACNGEQGISPLMISYV